MWLILSLLFGATRSRSYFLRPDLHAIGGLEAAEAGICTMLLALEEIPKDSLIKDEDLRKKAGGETTSGFLSRSILLWLSRMFVFGFRNKLSIDDLVGLGPTLATRYLSERFRAHWAYSKFLLTQLIEILLLPFHQTEKRNERYPIQFSDSRLPARTAEEFLGNHLSPILLITFHRIATFPLAVCCQVCGRQETTAKSKRRTDWCCDHNLRRNSSKCFFGYL